MYLNLDEIISKCINNVLTEAKTKQKKELKAQDNALNNIQQHFRNKLDSGDKEFIDYVNNKGYGAYDDNRRREENERSWSEPSKISQSVNDDIKRVVKILQDEKYTLKNGVVDMDRLKRDYPDDFHELLRLKNFIDRNGLTYLYDKTANVPTHMYGTGNEGDINKLDFNNITQKEVDDYRNRGKNKTLTNWQILAKMREKVVNEYLEAKYGIGIETPDISYSLGNSKLPDDTLIVNFTSAMNCPAWNECLLKHSCYARNSEKQHGNVFRANENKGLYWIATQNDPTLLKYMFTFVRTFTFDYEKINTELKKQGLIDENVSANMISEYDLTSDFFTPEITEIMIANKTANKIRLNENGDFVGQWLVDAWDNEAGKYAKFGITVSAYTCRNFNYSAIKNIVLNVSRTFISKTGDNKNGIARHFIALPEDVYNALDETYSGQNNELMLKNNSVQPNPQPLYDIVTQKGKTLLQPNGKIYYKCPCDRKLGSKEINCYQCQLCYLPKETTSEMYVFVRAHGTLRGALKGYDLIKNRIGVSEHFLEKNKNTFKEAIEPQSSFKDSAKQGIGCVTNNAIKSLYQHMSSLSNGNMNESKNVIKITQNELVQMIKESLYKIKGSI